MTARPAWDRFIPRNPYAAAIGLCFVLLLGLSLGRGLAQAAAAASGAAPVAGLAAGTPATTDDALREQVAGAGWLRVQVELRQPAGATAADLDQAAQDLLSALPAGSYNLVLRVVGATSLSLRVDAAGLDGLLGSPLVAAVTAENAAMQRISGGGFFSVALKTDGSLWAWGQNWKGQLGDGTTTNRLSPFKVIPTGVAAVAAHGDYSLALKTDGSLWAWGPNWYGQLGDGTPTDRWTPVPVMTGVAGVAGAAYHTLALKTDGSLWTWGANGRGQLGDGTGMNNRWSPVQVSGWPPLPDFAVTSLVPTPGTPTANGTFLVAVTVKNRGSASGDGGWLDLWFDQPAVQTCGTAGNANVAIGTLAAGAVKTLTFTGLRAGGVGPKTLRAFVDSVCQTGEANEGNNQGVLGYSVIP